MDDITAVKFFDFMRSPISPLLVKALNSLDPNPLVQEQHEGTNFDYLARLNLCAKDLLVEQRDNLAYKNGVGNSIFKMTEATDRLAYILSEPKPIVHPMDWTSFEQISFGLVGLNAAFRNGTKAFPESLRQMEACGEQIAARAALALSLGDGRKFPEGHQLRDYIDKKQYHERYTLLFKATHQYIMRLAEILEDKCRLPQEITDYMAQKRQQKTVKLPDTVGKKPTKPASVLSMKEYLMHHNK